MTTPPKPTGAGKAKHDASATVDPRSESAQAGGPASEDVVVVLLFHAELSRIGEIARLSGAQASAGVVLGRDAPAFSAMDGTAPSPIADPCVSRSQAAFRWLPESRRFFVERAEGARRELRLLRDDGTTLGDAPATVPAGTLVAIGDRVLLSLDAIPAETPPGDGRGAPWGCTPRIVALEQRLHALARGDETVLVEGETGVGKELVARRLHEGGARRREPFVAVNCAALPENLVESELFGYGAGAFSGASHARRGLFHSAGRGTVFLDELGELPLPAQAKLLRALEQRAVRPVGETHEQPFEARVVVATNRDLAVEVAAGRFRADLYARIEAPRVTVPPLRERRADVPQLFVRFLERRRAACPALGRLWQPADNQAPPVPMRFFLDLLAHDWPRNVRELDKLAAEVAARNDHDGRFTAPPLAGASPEASAPPATSDPAPVRGRPTVEELSRALEASDHVQHRAARALGVSRTTLDKWMRELGVRRPRELSREEIVRAGDEAGGDLDAAARSLGVSARGLRLRMTELGLPAARR